jgi:hypothetical protein
MRGTVETLLIVRVAASAALSGERQYMVGGDVWARTRPGLRKDASENASSVD